MIDFENIVYPALITSVENSVGSQLSTINSPDGTYPAIIRKRTDGARPPLNYMSVDIEHIRLPSGWLLSSESEYTNSEFIATYHILYEMYVCFECYGDNSFSILQQYASEYNVPDGVRYQLQRDAGLASHSLGEVKSIPQFISTNYEERAKLVQSFYIHDVVQRVSPYVEQINGDGTILNHDGSVLATFNIKAP